MGGHMRFARRTLILWFLVLIISGCGAPGKGEEFKVGDPDAPPPNKHERRNNSLFLLLQNQLIVCQHFSLKAYNYSCYTKFVHDK
jgi:hypothetical protein